MTPRFPAVRLLYDAYHSATMGEKIEDVLDGRVHLVGQQVVAGAMQVAHGELHALTQNAVLVALLLGVVFAAGKLTQRNANAPRSSQGVVG